MHTALLDWHCSVDNARDRDTLSIFNYGNSLIPPLSSVTTTNRLRARMQQRLASEYAAEADALEAQSAASLVSATAANDEAAAMEVEAASAMAQRAARAKTRMSESQLSKEEAAVFDSMVAMINSAVGV